MIRSTLFPAAQPVVSAVATGATIVALVFDEGGAVATAAGPVTVDAARAEGADTVVLTLSASGLRAATIGTLATVRVEGAQVIYTVPGGLPTVGGDTILLFQRQGPAKRAENSLAPSPPAAVAYAERPGQTGALAMLCDVRTEAVRVEALDRTSLAAASTWRTLREVAAGPGPVLVPISVSEDETGRRFRAVALRTVRGDVLASAPSAVVYRNRGPVSVGSAVYAFPTGVAAGRVPLGALVSDPDGDEMTYRVVAPQDTLGTQALPPWARIVGTDLVVDAAAEHAAVTVTLAGVDARGATATAALTVSVFTPTGPAAPGTVRYFS